MATGTTTKDNFFNKKFHSYEELNEALNIFQNTFLQVLTDITLK